MQDNHSFTLNDGSTIPAIGFGTWRIKPDAEAQKAVGSALHAGYRHIDTARIYENETGVGVAVEVSGLQRSDIFITTKLWNEDQGYETALQAIDGSLGRLATDYVDLYLIHWPDTTKSADSWRAMEEIQRAGKAKSIGVSNFGIDDLKRLAQDSDIVPSINQIELHPFNYRQQCELIAYCQEQGIAVEAYSPLRKHSEQGDASIADIAKRNGKLPSQVILRWCLQHDTIPLPRSATPDHISQNYQVFDFELSADDMGVIDAISSQGE